MSMTDEERMIYETTVSLRNNEIELRWTRTQLFFLINSAGLSFAVTQFQERPAMRFLACVIGIFLCTLWWNITKIIKRWVSFWEARLKELEEGELLRAKVFSNRLHKVAMSQLTAHAVLMRLVQVFFAAWGIVGIEALWAFLEGRP